MKNKGLLPFIILAIGIICIGFSAIFVKLANIPGPVSAFYRLVVAGVIIIPLGYMRKKRKVSRADILWISAGGIFFSCDLALWNTSLLYTSAATSTLLANNAPIWVGLASLIILKERLSSWFWTGLVISFTGMSVLVGIHEWLQLRFNYGDLLAIAASIFYAAYLIITGRARTNVDTVSFMLISTISSLLTLAIINILLGSQLTGYSTYTWTMLIALGLITHLGGWLCINYALGHIKAAHVSVSLLGQAVVTALVSIPLLNEGLTINQILGGVLVLTGIYFANKGKS